MCKLFWKSIWTWKRFALSGYLICSLRSKRHNALNVPGDFWKHKKAVIVGLFLTGDETCVHMFEPQRRADNKQWKRKDQKRPCIAKITISSKKMLHAIFFNSCGPVVQVPCPSGHIVTGRFYKNSVLKKVKWNSFTIRNVQAKECQESTFYIKTPSLISVRLLSLFWLLKRWKF